MLLNSLWNGLAVWVWWAEVMGKRACLLGALQEAGQAGPWGPTCSVPPAPPRLQLGSLLLAMCPVSLGISVWLPGNQGGGKRSGQSQLAWMPTLGLRAAGDHLQRSQERGGGWGPPGWPCAPLSPPVAAGTFGRGVSRKAETVRSLSITSACQDLQTKL